MIYNAAQVVVMIGREPGLNERTLEALAARGSILRGRSAPSKRINHPEELSGLIPAFSDVPECCRLIGRMLSGDEVIRQSLQQAHQIVGERHLIRHRLARVLSSAPIDDGGGNLRGNPQADPE